jgi:hypothetical protein
MGYTIFRQTQIEKKNQKVSPCLRDSRSVWLSVSPGWVPRDLMEQFHPKNVRSIAERCLNYLKFHRTHFQIFQFPVTATWITLVKGACWLHLHVELQFGLKCGSWTSRSWLVFSKSLKIGLCKRWFDSNCNILTSRVASTLLSGCLL